MDQQIYAMKIADIFNTEMKRKILTAINKKVKSIFPSPDTIYSKDIVKKSENNPSVNLNIINSAILVNAANPTNQNTNAINKKSSLSFNSKKNYFEEDVNNSNFTLLNNSKKSKKEVNTKNLMTINNNKFHYREKIVTNNDIIFSNYLKNNNSAKIDLDHLNLDDIEQVNIEKSCNINSNSPDKSTFNNNLKNNFISTTNINNQENDNNSTETTSTSSKEDNFNNINKKIENNGSNLVKNDENNSNSITEIIDIYKFNSASDNSHNNYGEINTSPSRINNYFNYTNKLFSVRESSRFDFVSNSNIMIAANAGENPILLNKGNNNSESINIPEFIFEIIKKKVSRYNFTKKISFDEDILYQDDLLEKEYNNSNPWAQFIIENKDIDIDKEFIYDFDKINKSLKDKFTTFYLK